MITGSGRFSPLFFFEIRCPQTGDLTQREVFQELAERVDSLRRPTVRVCRQAAFFPWHLGSSRFFWNSDDFGVTGAVAWKCELRVVSADVGCVGVVFRYTDRFSSYGLQASVAQLAEQLICNQQVVGSSPSASSVYELNGTGRPAVGGQGLVARNGHPQDRGGIGLLRLQVSSREGGFPSGQRGQTVNLMAMPSQVRILHPPFSSTGACPRGVPNRAERKTALAK